MTALLIVAGTFALAIIIVLAVDWLCTRKPIPDHEELAPEAESDRRKTIITAHNHTFEL